MVLIYCREWMWSQLLQAELVILFYNTKKKKKKLITEVFCMFSATQWRMTAKVVITSTLLN